MKQLIEKHYKENYDNCIRIVKRRAGSMEGAEDVVQEAYTRALHFASSFNPTINSFDTWFSRILLNSLRDYQRSERMVGMSVEIDDRDIEPIHDYTDSKIGMEELSKFIDTEPGSLKYEIVRLYFSLDYTPRDIAKLLDADRNTVRRYVWEFRTKLKEIYG